MENTVKTNLYQKFTCPGMEYRGTPFWSWNAELEPEEVRRQVRAFYDQGVGGFFIHSRDGLETPYMEEKWLQCVDAAVEEAKKLGMYAWLYDEDRWPSGTAGGQVSAGGDEYRLKGLTLQVCEKYDCGWLEENLIAIFQAVVQGDTIYSLARLDADALKNPDAGDAFKQLQLEPNKPMALSTDCKKVWLVLRLAVSGKSEWFNCETPPDNLNSETLKRFLHLTHDKYFERFGEEFGATIPGIFTDEPSLADSHAAFGADRSWIPWTYGFEDYFREKKGYDPIAFIPYVYFDGVYSSKIRHDYWHVIAIRYSENYAGSIAKWCREHHLAMTGHFLQEDKLGLSTRVSGAVMPLYEYEDIPGIDILQEKTDEFMTVKQCVSVAHQMGRKNVISETYGVTGWDFTFEGQRHIGDWQYALGVNRRCQHLALYSLTGSRKRDCPPAFGYNTPWWEKNHVVEDYFARLSAVLEEGEPCQQFLLLHPASTAWSMMGVSPYGNPVRRRERDLPKVNAYGAEFNALIEMLCNHHLDPDLGDEILLAKYGSVENGSLTVGKMQYPVVVLPRIRTLLSSTYKLLCKFAEEGGKIIVMEPYAVMLDGEESVLPEKLFASESCITVKDEEALLAALEEAGVRTLSIQDAEGREEQKCIALQKRLQDGEIVFVVNYSTQEACQVRVTLPGSGAVEEWDALTGAKRQAESFAEGEQTFLDTELAPKESRLFYFDRKDRSGNCDKEAICKEGYCKGRDCAERTLLTFPQRTAVVLTAPNTFILDICRYRMDGDEKESEPMQVWEAQEEIRRRLGMRSVAAMGMEQRYRWVREPHPADGQKIELIFTFEVMYEGLDGTMLALEYPEHFEIFLNQESVTQKVTGYLYDRGIKCVSLPQLRKGRNELRLNCRYRNSMELENCYLCGNFGVDEKRRLIAKPGELSVGSWTGQGLFHYASSVIYTYDFLWEPENKAGRESRIFLNMQGFQATCVTVRLGEDVFEIPWKAAGMVDVTEALHQGNNHLEIEVYSSLRNLFGPFHLAGGKPEVANDAVFRVCGDMFTPDYQVEPYGIMKAPSLIEKFVDGENG